MQDSLTLSHSLTLWAGGWGGMLESAAGRGVVLRHNRTSVRTNRPLTRYTTPGVLPEEATERVFENREPQPRRTERLFEILSGGGKWSSIIIAYDLSRSEPRKDRRAYKDLGEGCR